MSRWIMEVLTECKVCLGTGTPHVRTRTAGPLEPDRHHEGPCHVCGGSGRTWYAVHGGNGEPYSYPTARRAGHMLRVCYPEQLRDARLGGDPEVRITEVFTDESGLLSRTRDGSEVACG